MKTVTLGFCSTLFASLFSIPWCHREKAALESVLRTDHARKDLQRFTQEPHPTGSVAQEKLAADLKAQLQEISGLRVWEQSFSIDAPNPPFGGPRALTRQVIGRNIFAMPDSHSNRSCILLIGSHYDSKDISPEQGVGANDSGSSSVVLVDLARDFAASAPQMNGQCGVAFVWFDAEEAFLPQWNGWRNVTGLAQDNTYGSRHLAQSLVACKKTGHYCFADTAGEIAVRAVLVVDMVGSRDLALTPDSYSNPDLRAALLEANKRLDKPLRLGTERAIEDDHIPFLRRGIPAAVFIDFENITTWHQSSDTVSAIDFDSIERAKKLVLNWIVVVSEQY